MGSRDLTETNTEHAATICYAFATQSGGKSRYRAVHQRTTVANSPNISTQHGMRTNWEGRPSTLFECGAFDHSATSPN